MTTANSGAAADDARELEERVARIRRVSPASMTLADALALLLGPRPAPEPAVRRAILMRSDCPMDARVAAFADADAGVRAFAVGTAGTPIDAVLTMADDPDWQVRLEVAKRPDCATSVLARLAADPDSYVSRAALSNPGVSVQVLIRVLVAGTSRADSRLVALNEALNPRKLAGDLVAANDIGALELLGRDDLPAALVGAFVDPGRPVAVRLAALAHARCPVRALSRAATGDPDASVRACAVGSSRCPAAAVLAASSDPEPRVRERAATSSLARPETLAGMVERDPDPSVRCAAVLNPRCLPAAVDAACEDPDVVLEAAVSKAATPLGRFNALVTMAGMPRSPRREAAGPGRRLAAMPAAARTGSSHRHWVHEVALATSRRTARKSWRWIASQPLELLHPDDLQEIVARKVSGALCDERPCVRAAVARLPDVSVEALVALASDPDPEVRRLVTERILAASGSGTR